MRTAHLGLGSNLGDKAAALRDAAARLAAVPGIAVVARSGLYRTPPWGDLDQDWFLNAALGVRTTLTAHRLLDACLAVEAAMGRVRERRWGPRLIDIDVIACEGARIDDDRLVLPHPHARVRGFVLLPLAEIAPALDLGGETVREALGRVETTGIERVDDFDKP